MKGPGEVDGEDTGPVVVGHAGHEGVARDAGVVDEDVEASEGLDGLLDEGRGGVRLFAVCSPMGVTDSVLCRPP